MNPFQAVLASALLGAALSLSAAPRGDAPAKSLYSAPVTSADSESPDAGDAPAPSPAMEDKFRKLQKEMENPSTPGAATATAPQRHETVAMGTLAMQILFGLAFVLLLAVVCIRGLKKMQGRLLSRPRKGGDLLEVLETCHLGPQQKVIAIRMNEDVGILGVTKEGINLLTVLKEPVDDLRKARTAESNSAAFSDNLNKLLDRFKKPKRVSDLLDEGAA